MKRKLLSIMMISLLLGNVNPQYSTAKNTKKSACAAYHKFLSNHSKLWSHGEDNFNKVNNSIKFLKKDINADSIPELLIYDRRACNGDGQLAVYAYVNGKVKFMFAYPLWEITFYCNKSGGIYHEMTHGDFLGTYAKFTGKKIKTIQFAYADLNPNTLKVGKKTYYKGSWDKKSKISKKAFNKTKSSLKKNAHSLKISEGGTHMYLNTSANRKKHI